MPADRATALRRARPQAGFTLIELMITVTVLGVLLALGSTALSEYLRNAKVRSHAEQVKSALDEGRLMAVRLNSLVGVHFSPGVYALREERLTEPVGRARVRIERPFEATRGIDGPLGPNGATTLAVQFSADGRSAPLGSIHEFAIRPRDADCTVDRCYRVRVLGSGAVNLCVENANPDALGACPPRTGP